MYKVNVDGLCLIAGYGDLLSDVLISAGKITPFPCAGNGTCGKCKVFVDGKETLSCQYKIKKDITVSLCANNKIKTAVNITESLQHSENMCYALDIGTTTLALALVSLDNENVVKIATANNPQSVFGADIISRIKYCIDNSAAPLYELLKNAVKNLIHSMGVNKDIPLYVAGNVTMLHMFFEADCKGMGTFPYSPAFLEEKHEKSFMAGVSEIHSLPSIHAFIGADIVAGMNFTGLPQKNKYNLLVDLGTNAEIVLFSANRTVCTSASAGPCFEGANISCGMGACNGAVCKFFNGGFKTINNAPPSGICGTGLIDIIAYLLQTGKVDKTGYFEEKIFDIADKVYLTDKDIRQFQLSKSAVISAIFSLLDFANITENEIENLYISGGFSLEINIHNAVITGLIPPKMADKCIAISNSCLLGSIKYATEKNSLDVYTNNAQYIDLSAYPGFEELFIKNMEFPEL